VADEEKKEEDAKKNKGEKKEAKPKGKSKLILIIAGVVLLLLVAGGGFFFMRKGSSEKTAAVEEKPAAPKAEHAAEKTEEKVGSGVILDLDPFVVNLADSPEIRYLKVTIKLELTKAEYAEEVNNRMPQIRDSLLILLSSKEYAAIRTVEGKLELRDEILQRLNTVLKKGVVQTAYFTDFVAQ